MENTNELNDVCKQSIVDKIKKAVEMEKMTQVEAGRLLHLDASYLSSIKKQKFWKFVPDSAWAFLLNWSNSGLTIRQYSEKATKMTKDERMNTSVPNPSNNFVDDFVNDIAGTLLHELQFSYFWDLYDKKVGDIDKIQDIWDKLEEEEKVAILEYIPKYKEARPDKYYRRDPLTFLVNKCWLDEIVTKTFINSNTTPKTYHSLADYSDQQLVDDLIRRGFSGEITKKLIL